jgi:hypothetical protein
VLKYNIKVGGIFFLIGLGVCDCGLYLFTVSFFKVRFWGSFGQLAMLAVGFGASLTGKVLGSNFLSGQGK